MKRKIYSSILLLLLSISLGACTSYNRIESVQPMDTSANDDNIDILPSSEEAVSEQPSDTYQEILHNKEHFTSTEDNCEYLLQDYLNKDSEFQGTYKVTQYTTLDMDGDQIPEMILKLSLDQYPEKYEILHNINGTVYGYSFGIREFEMLKNDGTYTCSSGAADVGIEKIREFATDSVKTDSVGYSQMDFGDDKTKVVYYIGKEEVTKEFFDAFLNQQNEKPNAEWSAISSDMSNSYYGDWVIQTVVAYGIGTYSSDEAEALVGKQLTFSDDKATIFNDEPSDTANVISNPEYQERTVSKSDFQGDYKMSFEKLGICSDTVIQVEVSGSNDVAGSLLIKDSNTMIMIAGGTYFELVKQ